MAKNPACGPAMKPGRSPASPPFPRCSPPARRTGKEYAMVVTTRIRLDRISSSTKNAALPREVIVGDEITAEEGYVLAVRILADKSSYNTIEDPTGRMLSLRAGDVLAGTLGARRALRGYAGVVPERVSVGDVLHV